MYHTNLIKAPSLVFVSKTDPIGAVSSNQRARESWENMGMKVCYNYVNMLNFTFKFAHVIGLLELFRKISARWAFI